MSGPNPPDRAARSAPEWSTFLDTHADLVEEARLAPLVLRSRAHWEDFLKHGYLDGVDDPDDFAVEDLDEPSYDSLKKLVIEYFEAGAQFFVPIALRRPDYLELARRFAGLEGPTPPDGPPRP